VPARRTAPLHGRLCGRNQQRRCGLLVRRDASREYLAREGADPARVQLLNDDFTYPFPNGMFDVVLSDQVIEHVADLDLFASEVARISA
jgi:hypothetical protein